MTMRHWQRLCIAALVGIFVLSFFLPVVEAPPYTRPPGSESILGCEAWYFGAKETMTALRSSPFLGPVLPTLRTIALFVLLPNILFAVGIFSLLLRRYRSALVVGVSASLDAGSWLLGQPFNFAGLDSGYYAWLGSMVLLALAGACFAFVTNPRAASNTTVQPPPPMLPDPRALALFNQPQAKPLLPTEVRPGTPPGGGPSSLQPPCSPSS